MSERMVWNSRLDEVFLELCIEQKKRGNNKKTSWSSIATAFESRFNKHLTMKQIANHHDELKKKWKAWAAVERMTGMTFDARGCPVFKSDDRWKIFVEKYPVGSQFHTKPLEHQGFMRALFVGSHATGVRGTSAKLGSSQPMANNEGSGDSAEAQDLNNIVPKVESLSGDQSESPPGDAIIISKRKRMEPSLQEDKRKRMSNIVKCLEVLNLSMASSGDIQSRCLESKYHLAAKAIKEIEKYHIKGTKFFCGSNETFA